MRKQRFTRLLAATLGLALIAGACGSDDDPAVDTDNTTTTEAAFPAGSTMARLKSAGKIVVGVKFDQPGFGLKNPTNGQVEGFDVEVAKLIVEELGEDVEIEFKETVSLNRETFIEDGTVDMVIATYTINDARKQRIDFAGPYFVAKQDIMVKTGDTSIKSVDDLNGKKVCTAKNSTSEKNVRAKAPRASITLFEKYSDCAQELGDGRIDAVSTDDAILAGLVKNGEGAFKLLEAPFSEEPYGIGVKKGDDAFREFVNDRLEEIFDSGEWAKVLESTIGLKSDPPKVDRYTKTPPAPVTTTTKAP